MRLLRARRPAACVVAAVGTTVDRVRRRARTRSARPLRRVGRVAARRRLANRRRGATNPTHFVVSAAPSHARAVQASLPAAHAARAPWGAPDTPNKCRTCPTRRTPRTGPRSADCNTRRRHTCRSRTRRLAETPSPRSSRRPRASLADAAHVLPTAQRATPQHTPSMQNPVVQELRRRARRAEPFGSYAGRPATCNPGGNPRRSRTRSCKSSNRTRSARMSSPWHCTYLRHRTCPRASRRRARTTLFRRPESVGS